jgi:hypothetical protein
MKKGQVAMYIILGLIIAVVAGGYIYVAKQTEKTPGPLKPGPENPDLTDDKVNLIAQNILQALNTGDYGNFTKDFSATLKDSMTAIKFTQLRNTVSVASGKYLSKSKPKKTLSSAYHSYTYDCNFEKENVQLTLTFARNNNKVEGINLNSPNIAKAGQ